jgi:hypothetical protein
MGARGRLRRAVVIGVAAAGCGGSSPSTSNSLDAATFAERYCALFAPCCTDAGVTQGASCKMIVGNTARLAGHVGELGETCLTELKAKFDGFGFCNYSLSSTPSCDKVLGQVAPATGLVPVGGDCSADLFSCAPSTRGDVSCTFDTGVSPFALRCQEEIPGGKAGDGPCVGTVPAQGGLASSSTQFVPSGYTCAVADGVYCDSTANQCAALIQPGQPCSDADVLACATNYCLNNICTARAAIGDSCTGLALCVDGATCDTTGVCAAKKHPGAACASSDECLIGDCTNAICMPPWDASSLGYLCAA